MLLCDKEGCEYACHTFCLKPPLHAVPEEEWVCPYCSGPSRKRTAKTTFASKEIEKLLGRRLNASKTSAEDSDAKFEYLVKWRSYSHHHDTWVRLLVSVAIIWSYFCVNLVPIVLWGYTK